MAGIIMDACSLGWHVRSLADTPCDARRHARDWIAPDMAWCREAYLDHLSVVFAGFSWHNLCKTRGKRIACEP